jgi:hypothetical protein
MGAVIRARILTKVLGGGPAGLAGAAALRWGWQKLREGREEEVLAVSRLKPGETYTVVTRPAPRRQERKLAKRSSALHDQLDKVRRPTRKQRKAARSFEKAERKALKARPGSARESKWAQRARGAAAWQGVLAAPSRRQRSLERKAALVDSRLDEVRSAAIARSRKGIRRIRRRYE